MDLIWSAGARTIASRETIACEPLAIPAQWTHDHRHCVTTTRPPTDPTYAFKPSLMGAMCQFTLRPDALEWQIGRRSGRIRYDARSRDPPVVPAGDDAVASLHHRNLVRRQSEDSDRLGVLAQHHGAGAPGQAYASFIVPSCRPWPSSPADAAGATGAGKFSTGLPLVTYWLGVVVFGAVMVATGGLVVRAMRLGQWSATAIVGDVLPGVRLSDRQLFPSQPAGPLSSRCHSGRASCRGI